MYFIREVHKSSLFVLVGKVLAPVWGHVLS